MSAAYETQTASVKDQVSEEEWAQRVQLAALYRLIALYGWDDLIFTHLSARVPGPEHHFLINPYGLMFEEITASSLVKVDLDGNKVLESPHPINPPGFVIHSAVHAARDDAQCVVHLHTDNGIAVSAQEHGLLPLSQHAMTVCWDVAYHDYEGIALDMDEQERLVADLGDKNYLILRNHGTLVTGENCARAFHRAYFLERACTMQIAALSGTINNPPQGAAEKVMGQVKEARATPEARREYEALYWDALLRKLERLDPSYKN